MSAADKYKKLDAALLACIKGGINTAGQMIGCNSAAIVQALAVQKADGQDHDKGKPSWRYIDARLKALRKAGKISYSGGVWVLEGGSK